MEQVFINLLKNAREAVSADGGQIRLQVKSAVNGNGNPNGGQPKVQNTPYIISIADNGAGIPDEVAEKIFIPFYTTKDSGSGVGLSLVKQIVHLHKGEINFETEAGKGTEFTVVV